MPIATAGFTQFVREALVRDELDQALLVREPEILIDERTIDILLVRFYDGISYDGCGAFAQASSCVVQEYNLLVMYAI